jgi:predicted Fe-Mo cluster-binding NifX family protein
MRIAIPICDGRISPVFDVARRLIVVDVENRGEISRIEHTLENTEITARARRVADLGVDVLICGAISLSLEKMLRGADVEVVGRTCGEAEQVLRAFVDGKMTEQSFLMPGCAHRRRLRTRRGRHDASKNEKGRDESHTEMPTPGAR